MNDIQIKYSLERERLETNRALDWSSFHPEFIIAGEEVEPMTVKVWFDLLAIKSPILYADAPTPEAIVDYIWRNSVRNTRRKWLKFWRLWRIERRVHKMLGKEQGVDMMVALLEHVKYSLEEYPADMNSNKARRKNSMSAISGAASMLDEIAARYSLNPAEVLEMPLRRAFSLQRIIRSTTIPDYKPLEPESLRAIKSEYLNQRKQNHG